MSALGVSLHIDLVDRLSSGMRNIQASVNRVGDAFKTTARSAEALEKEMAAVDKRMQNAAFLSLAAGRIEQTAARMRAGVKSNIDAIRPLEEALGKLQMAGATNLDMFSKRGAAAQRKYAGITSAAYVSSAAEIKNSISSLSDASVAAVNDAVVSTTKATGSQLQQMNDLFVCSWKIFRQFDSKMSDEAWANKLSGGLTAATKLFGVSAGDLQQAVRASGSEMTMLGSSLEDQLTVMGMISKKIGGERSAGALKQFASQAFSAQKAFDDLGYSIDLVDANGKLMPMVNILRSFENEFGKNYTADIGETLKKAFGSDAAAAVIIGLWGQQAAFKANSKAMHEAMLAGKDYTTGFANLADKNFDALLVLYAQRWALVKTATGEAMAPLLRVLFPVTEFFDSISEGIMGSWFGPIIGGLILVVTGLASAFGSLVSLMATGYGAWAFYGKLTLFLHTRNLTLIGGFRALGSAMLGGFLKACRGAVVGLWNVAVAGWAAIAPFWPIIAVVALVAGAAFLIVKFWKPISGFFVGLWTGIKHGLVSLWNFTANNPFLNPVGFIIKNWGKIIPALKAFFEKLKPVFDFLLAPFKPLLKLFEIGSRLLGSTVRSATAGAVAGAGIGLAPLPAPASLSGFTPIERTIAESRINSMSSFSAPITINAAPGQSSEDIAATVSRELDARARAAQAQQRARLYDD